MDNQGTRRNLACSLSVARCGAGGEDAEGGRGRFLGSGWPLGAHKWVGFGPILENKCNLDTWGTKRRLSILI